MVCQVVVFVLLKGARPGFSYENPMRRLTAVLAWMVGDAPTSPTGPCIHKSRLISSGLVYVRFAPKKDIRRHIEHICFVPIADINHYLFSAVVIALIRLVQLGGPVEIRPSTHWLASRSASAFSYLISQVALWLTITASRPPTVS